MATDKETSRFGVTANSLAGDTALAVENSHDLAQLETDFVCSRVVVDANLEQVGAPVIAGPIFLVLARGDSSIATVAAALNGSINYDRTPTEGEDPQTAKRALQRQIVLKIPMTMLQHWRPAANDSNNLVGKFEYNGPPLGLSLEKGSKRSYLFPRDIGWRWFIYNSSTTVLSGDTRIDGNVDMVGVWTQ